MLDVTSRSSLFFYKCYRCTGCFIIYLVAAFVPNIANADKTSWTPKEEALLEQYSKLMSLSLDKRIKDAMMFPELIICGGQSSGKTSTLNRLLGINLPVSDNTTTTVPTCIHTRKGDRDGINAEVTFCGQSYTVAESELSKLIDDLQNRLKIDRYDKGFSTEQLNIFLTRKECLPLSILDLPGRIKGSDIPSRNKLNEIYKNYLTQDGIILFVTRGHDDISDTFELFHAYSNSDGTPSFSTLSTNNNKAFFPKGLLVYTAATKTKNVAFYLNDPCSVVNKLNNNHYNQVGLGIHLLENYGAVVPMISLASLEEDAQSPNSWEAFETSPNLPNMSSENRYQPSVNGYQPNVNGYQPNFNGYQPNVNGYQPNVNGYQPNVNGYQPNVNGYQPNFNGYQPNFNGYQPNFNGYQPNASHTEELTVFSEEDEMRAMKAIYPEKLHALCGIKNLRDKIKKTVIDYFSDDTMIANATNILHDHLSSEKSALELLKSEVNQGTTCFRKNLFVLSESVKSLFSVDSTSGSLEVSSSFKKDMQELEYLVLVKCFSAIDGCKISLAWSDLVELGKDISDSDQETENIIQLYKDQCKNMEAILTSCYSKEYNYTNLETLYVIYSEDFFSELRNNMTDFIKETTSLIEKAIIDMAKKNKNKTGMISNVYFLSEVDKKAKDLTDKLRARLLETTDHSIRNYKYAACKAMETKNVYLDGFNAIYNVQKDSTPDGFVEKFKAHVISNKNRAKVLAGGASVVLGGMVALSLAVSSMPLLVPVGLVGGAVAAGTGAVSTSGPAKGLKRIWASFKKMLSKAKVKDNELKQNANGDFVVADALNALNNNQEPMEITTEILTKERWQRFFDGLNENPDLESSRRKTAILEALAMISSHHAQVVEGTLNNCLLSMRSSMSTNNPDALIHEISVQGFSDVNDYIDHQYMDKIEANSRLMETRIYNLNTAYNVISNIKNFN